jgi:hypothetical protein
MKNEGKQDFAKAWRLALLPARYSRTRRATRVSRERFEVPVNPVRLARMPVSCGVGESQDALNVQSFVDNCFLLFINITCCHSDITCFALSTCVTNPHQKPSKNAKKTWDAPTPQEPWTFRTL